MGTCREPVDPFYAGLRLLGRFWVRFLFRDVTVRGAGHVPPAGPVLLCVNHPNNLIDSLLLGTALGRQVHFLAGSALFRHPWLAALLARAGAIPVHRRQDDPGRMDRNAETFAACRRALAAGRLLAIYPEGWTHAEARVQPIRTGAARIALEYEAGRAPADGAALPPLAVVPAGLSFEARKSFRGRVLLAFGEPVPLAPHLRRAREDPVAAVQALTAAIQAAMQAQVVHVDRIDDAEVVRAVEELYRDDLVRALRAERGRAPDAVDPLELPRAIVDAVAYFKARDPDRVARTWHRIQHYRARLADCHVRDQAVRARLGTGGEPPHPVRASWRAVLGFPVFAYGAAVNALPYLLPRWLAHRLARRETDYATIRLLASIVAFPLFWGVEGWAVWRVAGPAWAAAFVASLPPSGLAAYQYARGAGRLGARARFAWLALTRRRAASRLLLERRAIVAELERARGDFLAATRGALQPAGRA
jgi:1-acyl-sn-glycerol-3-phosphate acyltransferase